MSCSNYLDVQPEDKYLEETVFSSEGSIQNVINGIYMSMSNESTYGGNLTMSTVDVLAQRYNTVSSNHNYSDLANYNYGQSRVQSNFDQIWTDMYINILNINKTLENLEKDGVKIPSDRLNILKGEVYGLRAMFHFDLLRLFGPIYAVNPNEKAIPYYDKASTDIQALLPASEVMVKILSDLSTANTLLQEDPVRTYGKVDVSADDDDSGYTGTQFYRYRNLRLNYFGVRALEARVHLYAGNTTEALTAAKDVIDEGSQWFEWVNPQDVISAGGSPDRIFSSEVLFGLNNTELYERHDRFFNANINDNSILAPVESRLNETFEANLNDFRFSSSWATPTNAAKPFKTFYKFSTVSADKSFWQMQPLIRMSEMYYIASETETNLVAATDYLNLVRNHRGLPDLDATSIDLPSELLKEYKREFYGEGQLFFYYKRKNMASIEDGSDASGDVNMDVTTYVIPLPESETAYR